MTSIVRRPPFLAVILYLCISSSVFAQVIPVKNSDFEFDGAIIHAAPQVPENWMVGKNSGKDSKSGIRVWNAPGSSAIAIGDASITQQVQLPALDSKLASENDWRLILAVDVIGKFSSDDRPGTLRVSINELEGKPLAQKKFAVENDAPISSIARFTTSASSFKDGAGNPENAFDGDRSTIWHSNYGQSEPSYPHHLSLDFGETKTLNGFTYSPRLDGGNGTVKGFEVMVTKDGLEWLSVKKGEFRYSEKSSAQTIALDNPVECRGFRLLCTSSNRGDKFASCSELIPDIEGGFDGLQPTRVQDRAVAQRCLVPLTFKRSKDLRQVSIELKVDSNRYVVVDQVHLFRAPRFATMPMRGKPNGHSGPDLLGAGSYGFRGLMIHDYPALPIIEVIPGSPAAKAGLRKSDLIVGIEGNALPRGNVNPGFEWFKNSHEALLGRAALKAISQPDTRSSKFRNVVQLNVLRDDRELDLNCNLRLPDEIASDDFLTNPELTQVLNDDLIQQVLVTQKKNGSWKNNPIHTCLGGLALLSTGKQDHAGAIKAAANYLLMENAEPGTGFYWHPSFSGIFLCEYYLATGDERALPVIKRMLRMMSSVFHTSKWGTETFGHGPRGLPYGNKSLVAVMVHVMVFEALAKRCGIESSIYETLEPYLESAWSNPAEGGHGAMGYNASYKDLGEFWSRTGLFMLSLHLRDIRPDMQQPMAKVMYERHPWLRNSHAYGEPGGLLGLIGLSQINSGYYAEIVSRYQWWFALAWQKGKGLDFTIPHMGAPYMEGPILINNGYAIVTNIHRKSLHITGSQKQNWLDVSSIPVPVSDVLILRDKQGAVELRCKIPGPVIYFTIDGSQPTRRSTQFADPFVVQPGAVVKALAVSGTIESDIAVRGFGFDKSNWKIVSANGHKDLTKSIRAASYAIDGDQLIGWVPDVGEETTGYPYELVVDLGQAHVVQLAGITWRFDGAAASIISIQASNQPDTGFVPIGRAKLEKFSQNVRIDLNSESKTRYLRFTFESPFKEGNPLLMLGEIDVR